MKPDEDQQGTETLDDVLSAEIDRSAAALVAEICNLKLKLATAESCTGGLLAGALTAVPGCEPGFDRGFVAYSEQAKIEDLGVPPVLIHEHTAVAGEVASAMAEGVVARSDCDLALAITGYADSADGTKEAGLVYFGVAGRKLRTHYEVRHFGDLGRDRVRRASVRFALELLQDAVSTLRQRAPTDSEPTVSAS